MLDLSIVIVNWKSVAFLRKCLATVFENTAGLEFEVLVVDNASNDGCGGMLSTEFPSVHFVQSEHNLGFARANNLGFENSTGNNILFLNPDTEIVGPAIQQMVQFLKETPNAGIVGPKLLNSDGSIQTSCIRTFPNLVNQALETDFLRERFPRSSLWGTAPLFDGTRGGAPVDAVSGASLMVKRQAFVRAGMFTSAYFMYSEDVDLCFQVRQAGWTNYFLPEAVVIHHGGQSTESRDDQNFADVVMRESRRRFFGNRMGAAYAVTYKAMTILTSLARLALMSVMWPFPEGKRRDNLRRSYRKWLRILRWSVGLEPWARQLAAGSSPVYPTQAESRKIRSHA